MVVTRCESQKLNRSPTKQVSSSTPSFFDFESYNLKVELCFSYRSRNPEVTKKKFLRIFSGNVYKSGYFFS